MEVVEEHDLKTTLRVAGGWVRDKVSGLECLFIIKLRYHDDSKFSFL
jgi:tRNA nucleotidyltransferase (CCA-adding enzyme)